MVHLFLFAFVAVHATLSDVNPSSSARNKIAITERGREKIVISTPYVRPQHVGVFDVLSSLLVCRTAAGGLLGPKRLQRRSEFYPEVKFLQLQ